MPLDGIVVSLALAFSLFSTVPIVGEPLEDCDEERLGVDEREREREMVLGTLESVVRAERATERTLLVSPASSFGEYSRGAEVGPLLGRKRLSGTACRESFECRGWGVDSEEARDTRDDVGGVAAGDERERSSGVDGELIWSSGLWSAKTWGVDIVEIIGVPDLL